LLVRADFVLGKGQAASERTYRRWRRILRDALPRLLGCERRCPKAERVRLHHGEGEGRFSGWLRIVIQRRPSRRRLRKFRDRLRRRLETNLLPIEGQVVKVGVRRCREPAGTVARPAVTEAVQETVMESPAA
jgi:hypothetical protein